MRARRAGSLGIRIETVSNGMDGNGVRWNVAVTKTAYQSSGSADRTPDVVSKRCRCNGAAALQADAIIPSLRGQADSAQMGSRFSRDPAWPLGAAAAG
jgi:hypothetical protein